MLKMSPKKSLVSDIVKQLEDSIVSGEYKVGEKLPSTSALQEITGTSQGTIREALSILTQKGLIEVKVGFKGGAFVKESNSSVIIDWLGLIIRQHKLTYKEIAEFRKDVEVGLIRLVTDRATKADYEKLFGLLLKMKKYSKHGSKDWPKFLKIEQKIREALLKIANNHMHEVILTSIYEYLYTYALQLDTDQETKPNLAYEDFKNIITALENRDTTKASALAVEHIDRYIDAISKKIGC